MVEDSEVGASLESVVRDVTRWVNDIHPSIATHYVDNRVDTDQAEDERRDRIWAPISNGDRSFKRICTHEAAHAIVGHKMGLVVTRACVREDGSGVVEYQDSARDFTRVFSSAVASLAGICVELLGGADDRRYFELSHSADIYIARREIEEARRLDPHTEHPTEVFVRTCACAVLSNVPAIASFATVLRFSGEADGAVVAATCATPN